jgi:hypothetical protein
LRQKEQETVGHCPIALQAGIRLGRLPSLHSA